METTRRGRRIPILLTAALLLAAAPGCAQRGEPAPMPVPDGLHVSTMTDQAVEARYRHGEIELRFSSIVIGENVRSELRDGSGALLSRIEVPLGRPADIADQLGALANQATVALLVEGVQPMSTFDVLTEYRTAANQLWLEVEALGDTTLRAALVWHEEVIVRMPGRMAIIPPDADMTVLDRPCPKSLAAPVPHTGWVDLGRTQYRTFGPDHAARSGCSDCDLKCRWWDLCCHHDEDCCDCEPGWYCLWGCEAGCGYDGCG